MSTFKLGVEKDGEYIFRILPSHTGAQFTAANCISLDRVKRLSVEFITSVYAQGAKDACGGIYVVESIHYIDNAKDKIFVLSDLDLHNYFKVYMSGGKLFVKSISRTNDDSEELAATTKSTQTATNTEVALESAKPPEAVKVKQPKADESATASPQQTNLVRAIVDLVAIAAVSVEAAVTDATHKIAIQQQLKTVQKSAQDSLVVAARVAKRDSLLARHQAHQAHKSIRCAAKSCSEALAAFASNSAPTTTATAAGLKREEPNVVLKIAAASEQDPVDLPKPTTPKQAPQDISPVAQEGPPSPQPQAALEQKSDDEDKKEPLFIHGRHTCDQCLATPVIGKRFRAINLPDYDLCEKCHGAYQGDKIQFEEAKLERDIPLQPRWQRKKALQDAAKRHGGRYSCCRAAPNHNVDDIALKEAIRRSLTDVGGTANVKEMVPSAPVADHDDDKEVTAEPEFEIVADTVTSSSEEVITEVERIEVETVTEEPDILVPSAVERNASFASDAEGSGDTADFVGKTLDRMGEAIDSLNEEMTKGDKVEEDSVDYEDDKSGSKIVDGDEEDDLEASWSVVVEEVLDDELARAAEAIGSALFNSDVLRSSEVLSAMTPQHLGDSNSSHSSASSSSSSSSSSHSGVSSVTSVPTTVHSMAPASETISPVQFDRWSVQLDQLHDMGFTNDALCIEVLDSLAAANIGCDSDDEVTVQQVVEKLMSGW